MFPNKVTETTKEFNEALNKFVTGAQNMIDANYAKNFPNVEKPTLEIQCGVKNVKIVNVKRSIVESVYCFVEIETGNVLKAAGFKVPAKGARGSIYSPQNGLEGVDVYGAIYKSSNGKLQGKIYV